MKPHHAAGKVNDKPAILKNVTPDKNIVWRVQGGQSHDIYLDIGGGKKKSHPEIGRNDGLASCLMDYAGIDWAEAEFERESRADPSSRGACINLGNDARGLRARRPLQHL